MPENAHREVPLSAIFRTRHGRIQQVDLVADEGEEAPVDVAPAPLSDEQLLAEDHEHTPEEDGLFSDFDDMLEQEAQEDDFTVDELLEEAASAPPPPAPPPPAPPPPEPTPAPRASEEVTDPKAPTGPLPTDLQLSPLELLQRSLPKNADPIWATQQLLSLSQHRTNSRKDPKRPWFKDVFRKEYVFAHPVRSQSLTKMEVRFVEEHLKVAESGRVLDLASGYGRHTTPLARRGYEMVGIDLSLDLLKIGVKQAEKEGLEIQFVHGDMRDLNFEKVFDGAFCLGTSFGYFSDMENLAILINVHRALKKGGRFILEVVNRDHAIQSLPKRGWWEGKGCLVQEDVEFNHATSQLKIKRYVVFSDGGERVYDVRIRLYSYHELFKMFEMVGLKVLDVTGSFHSTNAFFGPASESLIFTVQKPA